MRVIKKFSFSIGGVTSQINYSPFFFILSKVYLLNCLIVLWIFSFSVLSQDKIDLNKATVEELEKLPGIGPKIAENIVEYRKKFGPFRSIQELLEVKGIGTKRLKILKKYLKIEDTFKESQNGFPIYYYKDENGVVHYTQFPETVPERYRNSLRRFR